MKKILGFILPFFPLISFSQQINQQTLTNYTAFARLYGYVRYFHPSDEATNLNWNSFVYHGIKTVESAKNTAELGQRLKLLFAPVAPSVKVAAGKDAPPVVMKELGAPAGVAVKDVYWQHFGLGGNSSLYKSIRVNRLADAGGKSAGFGTATRSVDAVPHRGKRFRLRSMIKAEVSEGAGQMWVRIDNEGTKRGFFDNMDNHPVRSNKWAEYEIAGTVDATAKRFFFGIFLSGKGKVWADNFILEFEEQGEWKKFELENPAFESSATLASGWYTASPAYAYEIVSSDAAEGKHALLIKDDTKQVVQEAIFEQRPLLGDCVQREVSPGLWATIPLVLQGSGEQTYPVAASKELSKLQAGMEAELPAVMSVNNKYVRIAGVIIAWNVFRHFYPYQEEIELHWDDQLAPGIIEATASKNETEYLAFLERFTENLRDGHVSVLGPGNSGTASIQAAVALAEGEIVIDEVDKGLDGSVRASLKPGDVVLAIDGKPAQERFEELRSRISGSPQWKDHRALMQLFFGEKGSELVLLIERAGEGQKKFRLTRGDNKYARETPSIKKLTESIYYINISTASMDSIKAIREKLLDAKGIVCDLRGYPKNNHELINYLLSVKDTNNWMFIPRITRPDYKQVAYTPMGWTMEPKDPHIGSQVVFLTGGGAISYAESYMGFIKQYRLATIVGQPTAGANGNVNFFNLPGNYKIFFTGMKVRQQDGSQLQSIGIQPDVFVSRTVKGIAEGRDEYLEKALEILNSGSK